MEKERKIIKSINALQKSLFEYKVYIKDTPIDINREKAQEVAIKTANHLASVYQHFADLGYLLKSLMPKELRDTETELRQMDEMLGKIKAINDILKKYE